MRHSLTVTIALCARLLPATAESAPLLNAAPEETLPSVQLRGYGKVSGRFWLLGRPAGASVLQIDCESVAKAQLVHAKYLSDLGLLPGMNGTVLPGSVAAHEVAEQGAVAALRDRTRVLVFAARSRDGLAELLSRQAPDASKWPSRAEVAVPMFLDRWDKFGFRFYYRPFELPPSLPREQWKDYDYAHEFAWAEAQGYTGFVFWNAPNRTDTAEGLMNELWWDWGQRAARARNLPVALNLSAGGGSASPWLLNRYRGETQQHMPQYSGDFYAVADQGNGGHGTISWNATVGKDVELSLLQSSVRRFAGAPNVVSWLEPHGELIHGAHDVFLEYGPVADRTYREYLKREHGSLAALGARWYGDARRLRSWDEVRVPELASFLGWGPQALDLTGEWRVGYELNEGGKLIPAAELFDRRRQVAAEPAPAAWFAPDFDDSAWPALSAPGNDLALFLPQRPAVYRRAFSLDAGRLRAGARWWLYVWDLNRAWGAPVQAYLNGRKVGESTVKHPVPHWDAYEVTGALKEDVNLLALRLPQGYLAYRVYLSPDAPTQYPNFGEGKNAQWVDFCDWVRWSRLETCRRGIEMIRQIDPDRQITLMHPDEYSDGIKQLALDYGGEFHNTGYMGAFYADYNPLLMQGAGLPFSLEPGGPPPDLPTYRKMMGLYFSAGVQSVDYFIHIGDVLWNDDIRKEFEATQPLVHLIGKYHAPKAEVAVLYSTRVSGLTGFPWGNDPNVNLSAGYWPWNVAACLRDRYPRDGLTESDFARGAAARYRVIVDSNTSIMGEKLVGEIEKYVRAGGTFVTFVQTGRHTPTRKDAWPISRLTGYRVARVSRYSADGSVPAEEWHKLKLAPGQSIYRPDNWRVDLPANGLSLEGEAPDCQDLLLWEDGSVAVGMRALGEGAIVQIGAKFHASKVFDRIEPGGNGPDRQAMTALFTALLEWRNVKPAPAQLSTAGAPDGPIILRHWISNNGLYDVWTLWNQDSRQAVTTDLLFDQGLKPTRCLEVVSGQPVPMASDATGSRVPDLQFEPGQTRALLTPRGRLPSAGRDWFALQRSWWRGTKPPSSRPLPAPPHKLSVDLTEDWAWKPLAPADDPLKLTVPEVDDRAWPRMPLRVWGLSDHPDVKHALLRRRFTVPANWTNGRIALWLQSFFNTTFLDRGRVFLDGELIRDWSADALQGVEPPSLRPGSSHVLAVEIQGESQLRGSRGACWLWYRPDPDTRVDLSGEWSASTELLRYDTPLRLPGDFNAFAFRRTVPIPAEHAGKNVVLNVDATGPLLGVLINGHWVRRFHHMIGSRWDLDLTPWVRFDGQNEIELVCNGRPERGHVNAVSLDLYEAEVYP